MTIKKVKIYIALEADTEEYPISADEQLEDDLKDQIESFIYDVGGLHLNKIKLLIGD